ncbi:UNVERIFIED_ORG: hypothetical protein ABIB21_003308 [Arthrobacter sp. UYEF13]
MNGVGTAELAGQGRRVHKVRADKIDQVDGPQHRIDGIAGKSAAMGRAMEFRMEQHRSHQLVALGCSR